MSLRHPAFGSTYSRPQYLPIHGSPPILPAELWTNLERWIRKHNEDKIILLGDLNSTFPAGRGLHGVTWRNVGRYRKAGLSELIEPELSDALRPNGTRWRE